jgi:DNA-binding NarL/FixJ family response regulator
MPKRIVIIDDDESCLFLYRYHFRDVSGVDIIAEFDNAEEALIQIPQLRPDGVIADYSLPGMSGIEFAEQLIQYPEIKVLLVTGHALYYLKSRMKHPPNFDVIQKDWSETALEHIKTFCMNSPA